MECSRLAFQNHQQMPGTERFLAPAIAADLRDDELAAGHYRDAIDLGRDLHDAERPAPRHVVTVSVETHRVVFVPMTRH